MLKNYKHSLRNPLLAFICAVLKSGMMAVLGNSFLKESKSENCYLSENHISISQPLIITYKSVHFQFSMTSCTCCCHRNCQLTQLVFSLQLRTSYDCEALVKEEKAESLNRESDHPGWGFPPAFTSHLLAHASPNNTISSLGLSRGGRGGSLVLLPTLSLLH